MLSGNLLCFFSVCSEWIRCAYVMMHHVGPYCLGGESMGEVSEEPFVPVFAMTLAPIGGVMSDVVL